MCLTFPPYFRVSAPTNCLFANLHGELVPCSWESPDSHRKLIVMSGTISDRKNYNKLRQKLRDRRGFLAREDQENEAFELVLKE